MRATQKNYVPILKTRAGERWAIDHLAYATKRKLTPLFELHRHRVRDDVTHAEEIFEDLSSIWGTATPFFLDTCWLHEAVGDPTVVEVVFRAARNIGLRAIPVVRVTFSEETLDVISDIHDEDGRGFVLRVAPNQVNLAQGIVDQIELDCSEVDLLLDYRQHAMNLEVDVPRIPNVDQWRSFTAASGAFPRSVGSLPRNRWSRIDRHDWSMWDAGVRTNLARRPAFGDYTTRDPGRPAEGGQPSVHLRYTTANHWRVRVGGQFQEGDAPDMHEICATLVSSGHFQGPTFSQGDHEINEVALRNRGPGNPQQWVQWGMNHHMTFVVNQIQNHAEL